MTNVTVCVCVCLCVCMCSLHIIHSEYVFEHVHTRIYNIFGSMVSLSLRAPPLPSSFPRWRRWSMAGGFRQTRGHKCRPGIVSILHVVRGKCVNNDRLQCDLVAPHRRDPEEYSNTMCHHVPAADEGCESNGCASVRVVRAGCLGYFVFVGRYGNIQRNVNTIIFRSNVCGCMSTLSINTTCDGGGGDASERDHERVGGARGYGRINTRIFSQRPPNNV